MKYKLKEKTIPFKKSINGIEYDFYAFILKEKSKEMKKTVVLESSDRMLLITNCIENYLKSHKCDCQEVHYTEFNAPDNIQFFWNAMNQLNYD